MPKLIVTGRYIKPNAHKRFGNYILKAAIRRNKQALGLKESPLEKPDFKA